MINTPNCYQIDCLQRNSWVLLNHLLHPDRTKWLKHESYFEITAVISCSICGIKVNCLHGHGFISKEVNCWTHPDTIPHCYLWSIYSCLVIQLCGLILGNLRIAHCDILAISCLTVCESESKWKMYTAEKSVRDVESEGWLDKFSIYFLHVIKKNAPFLCSSSCSYLLWLSLTLNWLLSWVIVLNPKHVTPHFSSH